MIVARGKHVTIVLSYPDAALLYEVLAPSPAKAGRRTERMEQLADALARKLLNTLEG